MTKPADETMPEVRMTDTPTLNTPPRTHVTADILRGWARRLHDTGWIFIAEEMEKYALMYEPDPHPPMLTPDGSPDEFTLVYYDGWHCGMVEDFPDENDYPRYVRKIPMASQDRIFPEDVETAFQYIEKFSHHDYDPGRGSEFDGKILLLRERFARLYALSTKPDADIIGKMEGLKVPIDGGYQAPVYNAAIDQCIALVKQGAKVGE